MVILYKKYVLIWAFVGNANHRQIVSAINTNYQHKKLILFGYSLRESNTPKFTCFDSSLKMTPKRYPLSFFYFEQKNHRTRSNIKSQLLEVIQNFFLMNEIKWKICHKDNDESIKTGLWTFGAMAKPMDEICEHWIE